MVENSEVGLIEMRCPHCGYWNSEDDHRCAHCGRRFEAVGVAFIPRRSAQEEEYPDPPPPSPAPPEAPPWRLELARKLEGYRERREKAGDPEAPPELWAAKQELPPLGEIPLHAESRILPQSEPLRRRPDPASELDSPLPPPPAVDATADDRPTAARAAPLERRGLAGILDLTLILVHVGVFVAILTYWRPGAIQEQGLRTAATVFFALLSFYWVLFVYYLGRTVGMLWVGLRVTALDGGDPQESQRLVRALGTVLSTASLGIGFAWALADEDGLTWHDRMSRTMVVESPV